MTFNQWACAGQGGLPKFRRAVGVLLLLIAPQVFFWSHGGPGPFHVPAWRSGRAIVDLPLPPVAIDLTAWAAYGVAALALILGDRGKAAPAIAAAGLGYYGSRDLHACNAS